MGLDMYLHAEFYTSDYSFVGDEQKGAFSKVIAAVGAEKLVDPDSPSATVKVTIAYWRKANAVHGWFVRNVQGGHDDCGTYYVERDQLVELRDVAQRALDTYEAGDLETAGNILTPVGGFFFGSTDVDEWWAEDMKRTVDRLTQILSVPELDKVDLYYHSSW